MSVVKLPEALSEQGTATVSTLHLQIVAFVRTCVLLSAMNAKVTAGPSILACCKRPKLSSDSCSGIAMMDSNFSGVRVWFEFRGSVNPERQGVNRSRTLIVARLLA